MRAFEPSPRHWYVLNAADRDNLIRDTYYIVIGFENVHGVALDLVDLGLIERDQGRAQYVPTEMGRQALAYHRDGIKVVMVRDGTSWSVDIDPHTLKGAS